MVNRIEPSLGVREGRVIAIVRGRQSTYLRAACDVLLEEDFPALEITTNTPGAVDVVAQLIAGGATDIGMGTVRTVEHVHMARDAGARFAVAPTVSLAVGAAAAEAGMQWYPGAATPTEIELAWTSGASAVKVFPAGVLGGARFIREVRAPLDDVALIPTGGIGVADVADYIAAGVVAMGIGSPLMGDVLETGDLAALRERAVRLRAAVADATR